MYFPLVVSQFCLELQYYISNKGIYLNSLTFTNRTYTINKPSQVNFITLVSL